MIVGLRERSFRVAVVKTADDGRSRCRPIRYYRSNCHEGTVTANIDIAVPASPEDGDLTSGHSYSMPHKKAIGALPPKESNP